MEYVRSEAAALSMGAEGPGSSSAGLRNGGPFLAFSTAVSSLLRAAFLVLAGRLLGPEPYAELYAALALIFLLGTGLTPMGSAIAHYASLYEARGEAGKVVSLRREMPRRLARWSLALLALGILAALPTKSLLGFDSLLTPVLVAVALALTLQLSAPRGLLRGRQLFRSYGINLLAESLLRIAVALPLLLWSATASSGLLAYSLGGLGALALGLAQTAPGDAEPVTADPRPLERMFGPLLVFALATASFQNLDMLFVKGFFPDAEAGLYAAAASVAKLTALAFLPFSVANLPVFTAAFTREGALGGRLLRALGAYLCLAGALVLALVLWGPSILRILFGDAYLGAAPWLVPLAAALALSFAAATIGQAFCAARRYGFLWILGGGLGVQVLALVRWRDSLDAIPIVLLAVQGLVLAGLVAAYLIRPPRKAPG